MVRNLIFSPLRGWKMEELLTWNIIWQVHITIIVTSLPTDSRSDLSISGIQDSYLSCHLKSVLKSDRMTSFYLWIGTLADPSVGHSLTQEPIVTQLTNYFCVPLYSTFYYTCRLESIFFKTKIIRTNSMRYWDNV